MPRQRRPRIRRAKRKDQRNSERTLIHDDLFQIWRYGKIPGLGKMRKDTQRALVLNEDSYAIHGEDVPGTQVILIYRRIATPLCPALPMGTKS